MILIYAYLKNYKNFKNTPITFDDAYEISFTNSTLTIGYTGQSRAEAFVAGDRGINNLHLLVGKTGSGKTNLLQLIGAKKSVRSHRKWDGEDDAYFLLYKITDTEFFLEICDIDIAQFPKTASPVDQTIPERIRENSKRMETIRTVRFSLKATLAEGQTTTEFTRIYEYGSKAGTMERVRDMAAIINCYDIHSFIRPPYADEKEDYDDFGSDWIGRIISPYHRTSLWQICDYIREYVEKVEPGEAKRQVSFVLSTHNFSDEYPIKLSNALEAEYWTFYGIRRDEQMAAYDDEAKARMKKRKKNRDLTNKQMFIHDLWADYAIYLRKWIEKIHSYNAEEGIPEDRLDYSGTQDVYQEFMDYYTDKEYSEALEPSELPDGQKMSIVKRCQWLAEYIDRIDNGDPHGLLWQIVDDIKDIGNFLQKLEDKYFTIDTCTVPVTDMIKPRYKTLFEDLFDRMEQYHPDDAGIFTKCLLPYEFTHLSTGEYQFAKVLGGIDANLKLTRAGHGKLDKIILLDEPEAYMHPELARQFIVRLYDIAGKYQGTSTVQIIIGTHSPFIVSDVLPGQVTRLNIDKKSGNAVVCNGSDKEYFGANIHTVLADSFFLDYTIGEYSRKFLTTVYDQLLACAREQTPLNTKMRQLVASVRQLLPHIGDRLIRQSFEFALTAIDASDDEGDGRDD